MKSLNKSNQKGFTIIEVLIVLAIAGIIMVIIFLAVPALQRNSRNTQRTSDASHMSGLISEWEGNNPGTTLSAVATGTGTTPGTLYLGSEKFSRIPATAAGWPVAAMTSSQTTFGTGLDIGYIYTSATCNGTTPTYSSAASSTVVYYLTEASTNAPHCVAAS